MGKLRKMKKAVNRYVILIAEHPEDVKNNYNSYIADVKELQTAIDSYIDKTADLFQTWCNKSVEVFELKDDNIFLRLKRYINMKIVNHYLNKFSYELSVSGILKNNLDTINLRLVQYDCLI